MMLKFGSAPAALSFALSVAVTVGCAPNLVPQLARMAGADPGPAQAEAEAEAEASQGTLSVTIRWPVRTGYVAQAIPDSTARVEIGVKDSGGLLVAFASMVRNPGETSLTKLVKVKVGSGYIIDVKAYPAGSFSGTVIAQGSASGVSISSGATTNVPPISLTGTFVPTVGSVDRTFAVLGGALVITGTNFQPNYLGSAKPTVAFAKSGGGTTSVASADVTVDSPTQVTVIVPTDATTGNLTVTHDGIVSPGWSATIVAPGTAIVSTLAGSTAGFADGTGGAAQFDQPFGVTVDGAGNAYVADKLNHRIRKITPEGAVSTLAGSGTAGFADGTGAAAQFTEPRHLAVDGAGNVYVADFGNHRIRKITSAGEVSTLAGSGTAGFADGPGASAQFTEPLGVAVDGAGNAYVADSGNHRIRKITSAGEVSTLAGSGDPDFADGTGAAAKFFSPLGVAVDGAGNVYVGDGENRRIRKITSGGEVTTLAGSNAFGSADGTAAAAEFRWPVGLALDGSGNIYVADKTNNRIRKVTPAGVVTTLAGSSAGSADGLASAAEFGSPEGVAVDAAGNVYVADSGNHRFRLIKSLSANGTFKVSAGNSTGAVYKVPGGADLECRFQVLGGQTWSDDNGSTTFGAGGRTSDFATSAFTLNSGKAGSLIVKRGDNSFEEVGADRTFIPSSGEVLTFLMNDLATGYANNTGGMTITYSCGKVDAGNLNLTIQ